MNFFLHPVLKLKIIYKVDICSLLLIKQLHTASDPRLYLSVLKVSNCPEIVRNDPRFGNSVADCPENCSLDKCWTPFSFNLVELLFVINQINQFGLSFFVSTILTLNFSNQHRRFQPFCLHLSAHTRYHFDHWYCLSMSQFECKCLSIVEVMPGHHLMVKIENVWLLAMHLCAAWQHGLCQLHVKLILQLISFEASTMASTGICERHSRLTVQGSSSLAFKILIAAA